MGGKWERRDLFGGRGPCRPPPPPRPPTDPWARTCLRNVMRMADTIAAAACPSRSHCRFILRGNPGGRREEGAGVVQEPLRTPPIGQDGVGNIPQTQSTLFQILK